MVRYEYADDSDPGCPTFTSFYAGTLQAFLDLKIEELESDGWEVVRYAYCKSKDVPPHRLNWRQHARS